MRPLVYTVSGVGSSRVSAPDNHVTPFNIALGVLVSGSTTYTVQYTFDDVFAEGYTAAAGNWTNHPTLSAQTATNDSNIAYPVSGVRLITAAGSTGTATLTLIQAGG